MPETITVNLDALAFLIDGTKIIYGDPTNKPIEATWGYLAYKAVASKYPEDQGLDWKAQYDRGKLSTRLFKGGDIQLTKENLSDLRRLFAKAYSADHLMGFMQIPGIAEPE